MKQKISSSVALAILSFLTVGCASGTRYSQMTDQLPSLQSGHGRIYFYRDGSPLGSAVQPSIYLNNEVVGKSQPGGFFFVDRPAGNYQVSTSTEAEHKLSFTLMPGEKKYIRTTISMGLFVGQVAPSLEDEATGLKTLESAAYIGPALSQPGK